MSRNSFRSDPRHNDESVDQLRPSQMVPSGVPVSPDREFEAESPVGALGDHRSPETDDRRRALALGRRTYLLRESELQAMTAIGTFRVVAATDLGRFAYGGDTARMEREVRRLRTQELAIERVLPTSGRESLRVVGLSKAGKRLLRTVNRVPETQELYHGIVKPREAKHDTELYPLFQAEAARIERAGGRRVRVVLDYELKRHLNRDRALLGKRGNDPHEIKALAERHGLAVVNGKIPVPDLRIEYQTADFEIRRIDIELATRHYRPRGVAEKAKAGFALYSPREDAPRLRRILDDQELTARIFAL